MDIDDPHLHSDIDLDDFVSAAFKSNQDTEEHKQVLNKRNSKVS